MLESELQLCCMNLQRLVVDVGFCQHFYIAYACKVLVVRKCFSIFKATVKVASTENGIIFSTIAYDVHGSTSDRNCVYLDDIRIDIMDYIIPGSCTDTEFRQMWAEFEWENKVNFAFFGYRLFSRLDALAVQLVSIFKCSFTVFCFVADWVDLMCILLFFCSAKVLFNHL